MSGPPPLPNDPCDLIIRLPQPVPLDLLPISSGSSASVAGGQWSASGLTKVAIPPSTSKDPLKSYSTKGKRPAAGSRSSSYSSVRSTRAIAESVSPATSFIDTGSSDEETEATPWPSTKTPGGGEPPAVKQAAKVKKPSLWQRALGGVWREKFGNKSSSFLASLRKKGGGVAKRVRIGSKAPKELMPKSWGEYRRAYAAREIDVDDLPPPPPRAKTALGIENEQAAVPTPYEAKAFFAPRPTNEILRQNVLNRIDVFGKYRKKESPALVQEPAPPAVPPKQVVDYEPGNIKEEDVCVPTPPGEFGPSLKAHPAFKRIVAFARQTFGTKFSLLSVLDNDQQVFLAESGLGGMEGIPRDIGFCAHTLLSSTKGLVILDTHKDWRFLSTPLVTDYHSRFYAGVPLLAPRDAAYAVGGSMPIGTLCIVDDEPRESFSELDRRRLIGLANYARSEIQTWSQARMDLKLASMDKSYRLLKTTLPRKSEKLETLFEGNTPDPSPRVPSAKPSPFLPSSKPSPRSSELSPTLPEVQTGLTPPLPNFNGDASGSASTKSEASIGGSSVDDESTISSAATSISPAHRTYSMATRLVAETLRFDLVYLVRVGTPSGPSTPLDAVKVTLIAAYGLPNTTAAQFDPNLHVKALRAPERGLLYQNPRAEELRSGEKFPAQEYASALLVPVADNKERGFVMAAYTTEPSRVFGAEDLLYMQSIANEVSLFLTDEA